MARGKRCFAVHELNNCSFFFCFRFQIENEGKPLTNQKSSGRCWLFAALNCIRIPFIKQYNLDEFEFSQAYLFYWDKIERANYFLNNVVDTAKRGEPVDGRLVSFLLSDPTCDGGQWDMLVNLINKHGLMPKKCFPESYSCEASTRMNSVVKSKVSARVHKCKNGERKAVTDFYFPTVNSSVSTQRICESSSTTVQRTTR